jgi:hypothetical protein
MSQSPTSRAIDLLHCRVAEAKDAAFDAYYDRKEREGHTPGRPFPLFVDSAEYMEFVKDWTEELAVLYELGLAADEVQLADLRGVF